MISLTFVLGLEFILEHHVVVNLLGIGYDPISHHS